MQEQQDFSQFRTICDWNLDVESVSESAIFPGPKRVKPEDLAFAQELAEAVKHGYKEKALGQRKTFGIRSNGIRYRVQPQEYPYFQLRTLHDQVMAMENLGIPKPYLDVLLSRELRNRGGLVLVGGRPDLGRPQQSLRLWWPG